MQDQASFRKPLSLWDISAQEKDYSAPFETDLDTVDVAIIGGGFTGLSTALHAAEAGLSARVLEAKHIGFGGSGRNVGLVNAGVWYPPAKVRKTLGNTYGPRFLRIFGDGPAMVFDLIEKHQIRCEATRSGTIHAASSALGLSDLQARHKEWRSMGAPVDMLSRADVERLTGTNVFRGGLLDHRAGTINPMGYCRGLARAALGAGAKIHTDVKATKLLREGDVWRVETDKGTLRARNVVLATNAYTDDLWPGLNSIFTKINYFQFATEPLGPEAAHILPMRQGLWDNAKIMISVRRDAYDRLLIGSMGSVIGDRDGGLSHRWAKKQIARLFPNLGPMTFEEAWHGQIAMTPEHLPRIYVLEKGLYTGIGYNGRGITTGTIFGRAMAEMICGMDAADLPLPPVPLKSVRSARIMSGLYQLAFTANQFARSL
jgi:glycine/D-amino acid oxidase-like deaminating enzyme